MNAYMRTQKNLGFKPKPTPIKLIVAQNPIFFEFACMNECFSELPINF